MSMRTCIFCGQRDVEPSFTLLHFDMERPFQSSRDYVCWVCTWHTNVFVWNYSLTRLVTERLLPRRLPMELRLMILEYVLINMEENVQSPDSEFDFVVFEFFLSD